jgi:energy-coupling factor transporter ATP-binding protein EcfA2
MTTEKVIAILGLKGAGKSTFLSVLNLALSLDQSPWRIRPVGESIAVMSNLMESLYKKGLYPDATSFEQEMEFFVEKEATALGLKSGARFLLKTADVPGEAVKGVGSPDELYHNFYEKHLKGCAGIIFLLDYNEKWREGEIVEEEEGDLYFPLFSSIFAEISEQSIAKPYVAFCVTKADMIPGMGPSSILDKHGYIDDIEEVAKELLGRNTKALIDQSFDDDHIYWLPVSSTGYTTVGEKRLSQSIEKTIEGVSRAGIRNPKDLQPIGVAEALEWVLDNLADEDENVRVERTRGKKYADMVRNVRRFLGL